MSLKSYVERGLDACYIGAENVACYSHEMEHMTDEESEGKVQKDDDSVEPNSPVGTPSEDGGRRDFIKKLPYVAPVIQTFLFSEGTLASGNQKGNQRNQRRTQRGVSPNPGQGNPPPPPPKKDDDDG